MKEHQSVDSYIDYQPESFRKILEHVRNIIRQTAPLAEEKISYGMPAYKYYGPLVYFGAFKNHCSFFPGNASIIDNFQDELKNHKKSKGTIQFTPEKPLPPNLIKNIIMLRMKQNEEKFLIKRNKALPHY